MENNGTALAVVMPVYNEEEIIGTVIDQWISVLGTLKIEYTLHIYNDGSRDKTAEILDSYAKRYNRIQAHHQKNQGHGPTILNGYRENHDREWLFQVDSDNEIDAAAFTDLWTKRHEYDLLIGRRDNYANSMARKIISAFSRLAVRLMFGAGIYDTNSPFRLMRTSKFASFFEIIPSDTFAPNVIISGIAARRKMRIFEKKVAYHSRRTGEVSIKHAKLFRAAVRSFLQTVSFSLRPLV